MENPSDLITRKQIIDLNSSKLWWEGPIFLKEHDIFENKDVIEIDIIEEKRENTFVCLSDIKDQVDLNKYWILINTVTLKSWQELHPGFYVLLTTLKRKLKNRKYVWQI